jgi:hypothetical protein
MITSSSFSQSAGVMNSISARYLERGSVLLFHEISVTTAVQTRMQFVGTRRSSSSIALITLLLPAPVLPTTPTTVRFRSA